MEGKYEVFLSFRGPDTHRGFTSTLFNVLVEAGIHVFMDNEELRSGKRISGIILQAIDDSKLYIPIFSKNYASSHWCLDELAKMVENTSKSREAENYKVILPIFYDVDRNDVKLKTELYRNAISKLEQSTEEVKEWRHALTKVCHFKGTELEKYPSEWNLIQSVVEDVMIRLQKRRKEVTHDLVGMEDQIVKMNNLLDIHSGGVRFIGIYGMAGTGKTTLAKIMFNQLYPLFGKDSSFVDDVRHSAKAKNLVRLQEKLLSDISNIRVARRIHDIYRGINLIEDTICNKKVLIVLDDVDESKQIRNLIGEDYLYPGTRIIVTTRDRSVLKIKGFKYEMKPYEMKWLSHQEALQLFSKHAFDYNSPLADYYTLSKGIVSTTGGLPIALQAIGSALFRMDDEQIWEEMLEYLRKTINWDVRALLRATYDTLDTDQQNIFLDIACFFIGQNKIGPMSMWKDCGFRVKYAVDVLIDKSMIKILDDNCFWMHDQFKYLGRTIAREEKTRLWEEDDVIVESKSTEIKAGVRALCLTAEVGNPITVTVEQIKRFPDLQFLQLSNVICQGDLTGCLSKLKWISLLYSHTPKHHQGFEATNLPIENVVVAELSGPQFTAEKASCLFKGAKKLKVFKVNCDAPVKVMSRI